MTVPGDGAPPEPRRRGAVAVIVRERRLLVIRRSATVAAPRAICFPGGGIETGETESAAIIRELREELDLAVVPQCRIWSSQTPWRVELAWWHTTLAGDQVPRPNPAEVESFHWLGPDELAAHPDLLASNRSFLRALAAQQLDLQI